MTTISTEPDRPTTLVAAAGASYFPIAFLARLPFAMMVVGVLTLVVAARDSLSLGGLTSAMVGVGAAAIGPLQGMIADRIGQRRLLLVAGVATSLAMLAMSWVAFSDLPDVVVLAVAFVIGGTGPQVSPMSRSRLVGLIASRLPTERRQRVLSGTMAYESAADEIVFVFGPVIVGLLATTMNAAAPLIGAAVLTLVFVTSFAVHPSGSQDSASVAERVRSMAPARELRNPALLTVVLGVLGMGLFFGSTLTALTSYMNDQGHPERAGLVYGAMGIGSAVLALGTGLFPTRFTLAARWFAFAAVLVLGGTGVALAGSVPLMMMTLVVAGVGIGPSLVTMFTLGATLSPRGRSATTMTILGAAITLGQSAASAITGWIAESAGTSTAVWAPMVSAMVVLVAAAAFWRVSRGNTARLGRSETMVAGGAATGGAATGGAANGTAR